MTVRGCQCRVSEVSRSVPRHRATRRCQPGRARGCATAGAARAALYSVTEASGYVVAGHGATYMPLLMPASGHRVAAGKRSSLPAIRMHRFAWPPTYPSSPQKAAGKACLQVSMSPRSHALATRPSATSLCWRACGSVARTRTRSASPTFTSPDFMLSFRTAAASSTFMICPALGPGSTGRGSRRTLMAALSCATMMCAPATHQPTWPQLSH